MNIKREYSSPREQCFYNGVVCASVFTLACVVLIWTAPIVFAKQPVLVEYPTHEEISRDIATLSTRMAVTEEYVKQLQAARLRERVTIMETSIATIMKLAWCTTAGVFIPWLRGLFVFYRRTEVMKKRKHKRALCAAVEDNEEVQ